MLSTFVERIGPRLRRILMLLVALAMMGLPLHVLPAVAAEPHGVAARTTAEQMPSVEEILARHYEAIGGDDFQQVQTMKTTGTSVVMGMESPYARYSERPNKVLLEIYVQDMTGIQAFDGEEAWGYMPFMGQFAPEIMTAEQTRITREASEFDGPLVRAGEKGHAIELLGIEQVDGRDAYKLRVTMQTGGVQTHYVDAETYYVRRVESDAGDVEMHEYRLFDGHPVPTVIEMMGPYGEQTIYVDDVELGVAIDDNAFRMR
ncbi:MAG: hypothetical protein PVJ49_06580 [Acidobacteriota bacterium]